MAVSSGMTQDQYPFLKSSIANKMKEYSVFDRLLCGHNCGNDLQIAETDFCLLGQIPMLVYANAFLLFLALHSQMTIGAGG